MSTQSAPQPSKPTEPSQPDNELASYTRVLSAAMSQQGISLLRTDIDSAAKAVSSIRETFKAIGSEISVYTSQSKGQEQLKVSWTAVDGVGLFLNHTHLHGSDRETRCTTKPCKNVNLRQLN